MEEKQTQFGEIQKKLLAIDVSGQVEKKRIGGTDLSYLSWSYAWEQLIKVFPTASYEIERFGDNHVPFLCTDEGYMVFTKITIEGHTREMWLPVMNHSNQAVKRGQCDMMAINKTIMRCLVKNIAMFGLGLNVYQGEDLPNVEEPVFLAPKPKIYCESCGKEVVDHTPYTAQQILTRSQKAFGKNLCYDCAVKSKPTKSTE